MCKRRDVGRTRNLIRTRNALDCNERPALGVPENIDAAAAAAAATAHSKHGGRRSVRSAMDDTATECNSDHTPGPQLSGTNVGSSERRRREWKYKETEGKGGLRGRP